MASTNTQWHNERGAPRKGGKHEVSQIDLVAAKLEVLMKKIESLQPVVNMVKVNEVICEYCAGNHRGVDCVNAENYEQPQEEASYVGNQYRYQNNNQRRPQLQQNRQYQSNQQYRANPDSRQGNQRKDDPSLEDTLKEMLKQNTDAMTELRNQFATAQSAHKRLDTQVAQIAEVMNAKGPDTHCKAITLRSGS